MKNVTLGSTGIVTPQNGFGALPLQRISEEDAIYLLRRAFEGGMTFFDTARAYSNSEERVGKALHDVREQVFIATKAMISTPEQLKTDLETSLSLLQTDHVDLYQPHCVPQCYKPGDGTGIYETLLEMKAQGKITHIGVTAHKVRVARECVESGLYETLQYPLSYLSNAEELELVELCRRHNMGFIAMKGMAGGLLNSSKAAMAFMTQFDNVVPIWGVQRKHELEEWLSYMDETPTMSEDVLAVIAADQKELSGNFCRGCGYCMPCTEGIMINQAARIELMLKRAPSDAWLSPFMQAEMAKVENCQECGACLSRCPYGLDIPELLRQNLDYYNKVLAGEENPRI